MDTASSAGATLAPFPPASTHFDDLMFQIKLFKSSFKSVDQAGHSRTGLH